MVIPRFMNFSPGHGDCRKQQEMKSTLSVWKNDFCSRDIKASFTTGRYSAEKNEYRFKDGIAVEQRHPLGLRRSTTP